MKPIKLKIETEIKDYYRGRKYSYTFNNEREFYCSFWQFTDPETGEWQETRFDTSNISGFTLEQARIALLIQEHALKDMENAGRFFGVPGSSDAVLGGAISSRKDSEKRRTAPDSIAGKAKILGDIVSPFFDEVPNVPPCPSCGSDATEELIEQYQPGRFELKCNNCHSEFYVSDDGEAVLIKEGINRI